MMKIRTFSELRKIKSFEERFEYLKLSGEVGKSTFGFDRYLNQAFYNSKLWLHARDIVITRDNGCDLGSIDHPIITRIIIHHMNPVTIEDLEEGEPSLIDPEYLISVSHKTHLALHYGDANLLEKDPIIRKPGDTSPWLMEQKMAKRNFPVREEPHIKKVKATKEFSVANCRQVNVRKLPSRDSSVLFIAAEGTLFSGEHLDNGWTKVTDGEGRAGYIASDFLEEHKDEQHSNDD